MLKKFSKFLLLMLVIFVISSSSFICLADEVNEITDTTTTSEGTEEEATTNENTSVEPEIHNGDLYPFGNEVVMDKYVDGNVFIVGNKVRIKGQVNGNLYILANQINLDGGVIRYSIFACAGYVYLGTGGTYEGDVYVASHTLETTYNSYVARDIKAIASDITFKSAVGRDADLICNTLSLGEGADIPIIYGNLRYTSDSEISIPDNVLSSGFATYTKPSLINNIIGILLGFGTCIVTALAIYIILNKISSNFVEKVCAQKFSVLKILKAFGIGLATIAIVSIFIILLVGTFVGILLGIILALLFAILCIIAVPMLAVSITNQLKPALKIEKDSMFYLVLTLVSIILYGITLIPYAGVVLEFLITVAAIGLIVNLYLPHKELTDEEKTAIEEAEKQAKKDKQEKLKAKAAKKQEKLEDKEAKKKDN